MIVLRSSLTPPLEYLCETPVYVPNSVIYPNCSSQYTDFRITDWNKSRAALLFLAWNEPEEQQRIIKLLRPYQDMSYSLETLSKRQQCLLEALRFNRVFASELYIGLAPLYGLDLQKKNIRIGEVITNPTRESLHADIEYVLLMKPQDRDHRLDYLLANGEFTSLMPLVEYVADMHNNIVSSISSEESIRWGRYDHLIHKLEHNLKLLDLLVERCSESDWDDRKELVERTNAVKIMSREVAMRNCYTHYFPLRIAKGHIKHCHGDIKSPHIWIASDGRNGEQAWSFNILDAVDFNDMYNRIDILSDFALLITDLQARAQSPTLIKRMIDCYLSKTHQGDEVARGVLDYYILEKAIVGTGISILYDDEPQLGRSFLKVAENHLESIRSISVVG